tara:strand:+ start:59 stop:658 length:600 start_codon:yes stop_codon:yes gene_type:complete
VPYNHKIADLKYRINGLVPENLCKKFINLIEKYPELCIRESSYKYQTEKTEEDNYRCLNLSRIKNPNDEVLECFAIANQYINIMVTNYVLYIKSQKIGPTFTNHMIDASQDVRILKYKEGECIKDHADVDLRIRASCTLNLNENYEGGEFRFFDGQIKESFKTGDAMLFPAEPIWIHGTEPITKGTRYALNCFLEKSVK